MHDTPTFPPGWSLRRAFSADGGRVATAAGDGVQVWDARTGRPVGPRLPAGRLLVGLSMSPDGRRLAVVSTPSEPTASTRGQVQVWDTTTGERWWDVRTGKPAGGELAAKPPLTDAALSRDGSRLFTTDGDSWQSWDAATGAPAGRPSAADLALAGADPLDPWPAEVDELELGDGVVRKRSDGTAGGFVLRRGPDPRTVLGFTRLGIRGAFPARSFHPRAGGVAYMPLSPAVTSQPIEYYSGEAGLWDARTGEPLMPPLPHVGRGPAKQATDPPLLSPDGRRLLLAADLTTLEIVELPGPDARPVEELDELARALSGRRIEVGKVRPLTPADWRAALDRQGVAPRR
jgi:WD40 repeat protein